MPDTNGVGPAEVPDVAHIVTLARLQEAEAVVRRYFPPTPLLPAPGLSVLAGVDVYLKLESMTPLRTFKIRGALSKLAALERQARERQARERQAREQPAQPVPAQPAPDRSPAGVATASAGNHGMAVAYAAAAFGRPATIFVPEGANPQKIAVIERCGGRVIAAGTDYQAAFERCEAHAAEHGQTIVHAYDDPDVIAGQGTVGLELARQLPAAGVAGATVYVGIGGGGLISGIGAALGLLQPDTAVIGACPAGADALARSVEAGTIIELERVDTFADGLAARRPGRNTLALAQRHVREFVRVSDEEIWAAMTLLLRLEGIVAEPAGAAAVAALLRHRQQRHTAATQPADKRPAEAQPAVVVISGANIADTVLQELARRVAES